MKDEGHSVLEWVVFHHLMGFDNLVAYTNDCSDHTDDMLIRLQEMGYCQHFRNDIPEGKKPQPNCLRLAEKNPEVTDTEWLLVMDADEFVNVKCNDGKISDLINAVPDNTDAITLTWRFFGSSEIQEFDPGIVIQSYTRAAPDRFPQGWGVKTMFRPYEDMKLGIHRPHMKKAKQEPERLRILNAQKWVNGSGKPMPDDFNLSGWRSTKPTLGYDLVEMNHYALKSYESYLLRRARGNVNNKVDKYNWAYFSRYDRNEVEIKSMKRFVTPVRQKMRELLRDDKLRDLQQRSLAYHRDIIAKLRSQGDYDAEISAVKEASKVEFKDAATTIFYHHLPLDIQNHIKGLIANNRPEDEIKDYIKSQNTNDKLLARMELKRIKDIGVSNA